MGSRMCTSIWSAVSRFIGLTLAASINLGAAVFVARSHAADAVTEDAVTEIDTQSLIPLLGHFGWTYCGTGLGTPPLCIWIKNGRVVEMKFRDGPVDPKLQQELLGRFED